MSYILLFIVIYLIFKFLKALFKASFVVVKHDGQNLNNENNKPKEKINIFNMTMKDKDKKYEDVEEAKYYEVKKDLNNKENQD